MTTKPRTELHLQQCCRWGWLTLSVSVSKKESYARWWRHNVWYDRSFVVWPRFFFYPIFSTLPFVYITSTADSFDSNPTKRHSNQSVSSNTDCPKTPLLSTRLMHSNKKTKYTHLHTKDWKTITKCKEKRYKNWIEHLIIFLIWLVSHLNSAQFLHHLLY